LSLAKGDLGRAESLAREGMEIRRKALGTEHADFGTSLMTLGSVRLAIKPDEEAEELLRRGAATLRKALPAGHWRIAEAESRLGAGLAARRKPVEAEPLLVGGYEILRLRRGAQGRLTVAALKRLVAFYEAEGKTEAAASYRSREPQGPPVKKSSRT
jgi:hypothetical protein